MRLSNKRRLCRLCARMPRSSGTGLISLSTTVTISTPSDRGIEAMAQGDDGPPRGRELETADLRSFINGPVSATRCGSPRMYTIPPRTILILTEPHSRISTRSGSLCQDQSTLAVGDPNILDMTLGPQVI